MALPGRVDRDRFPDPGPGQAAPQRPKECEGIPLCEGSPCENRGQLLTTHVPRFGPGLFGELALAGWFCAGAARMMSRAWSLTCCIWASRLRSVRVLLSHWV